MGYLKIKDWRKAENDATSAVNIDPSHWKSYHRRSIARSSLGKIRASRKDLQTAKQILENQKEKDGTIIASLKKIDADLVKNKTVLIEVMRKAPKKVISIKLVAGNSAKKNIPNDDAVSKRKRGNDCGVEPIISPHAQKSNDTIQKTITRVRNVHSWLEFEQIWKSLPENTKPKCIENLRPQALAKMYSNGIEDSDLLLDIIKNCTKIDSTKGRKILLVLCKIPNIDMVVMMMSSSEKCAVAQCVQTLASSKDEASHISKYFGL